MFLKLLTCLLLNQYLLVNYQTIVSYRIVMYTSEVLVQKHQRSGPKQTGKFLTVLRMFTPTVCSHRQCQVDTTVMYYCMLFQ